MLHGVHAFYRQIPERCVDSHLPVVHLAHLSDQEVCLTVTVQQFFPGEHFNLTVNLEEWSFFRPTLGINCWHFRTNVLTSNIRQDLVTSSF